MHGASTIVINNSYENSIDEPYVRGLMERPFSCAVVPQRGMIF
jgi:hypothetical protein